MENRGGTGEMWTCHPAAPSVSGRCPQAMRLLEASCPQLWISCDVSLDLHGPKADFVAARPSSARAALELEVPAEARLV